MKKLVAFLVVLAFAGASQASELYWMLSNTTYNNDGTYTTTGIKDGDMTGDITWNTVTIYANGAVAQTISASDLYDQWDVAFLNVDGYEASTSFYAEIKDSQGRDFNAQSATVQLADLSNYLFEGGIIPTGGTAYAFTNFAGAVPEPTTGLLMLFGLAGLALKRRRA